MWHITRYVARDMRLMCCTWSAHDCAWATWAYVLETVHGAVKRLSKISNCAIEWDYYYYYKYLNVSGSKPGSEARTRVPVSECQARGKLPASGVLCLFIYLFACFFLYCWFIHVFIEWFWLERWKYGEDAMVIASPLLTTQKSEL